MNYYERHLGDYAKDTGHLSMLEHGAYTLLLDRYYSTEQGIQADQAHRIARARTKEERAAVDAVLSEFFTLANGVWTKGRVEEEIAAASARINAARANGKKGGRKKKNPEETQREPSGFSLGSENETQSKAHQTPDTRHQIQNTEHTPSTADGARAQGPAVEPTAAGAACKAMRAHGVSDTNPGDPRLLALLAQGATLAEFEGLAEEAVRKGIGKPFGWVLTVLPARREQAASLALAPQVAAQTANTETAYQRSMRERIEAFAPEIAAKVPGGFQPKPAAVIESETTLLEGPQ